MRPRAAGLPAVPRGFTLIELLVVAGLIAVMAAVSIPGIARYLKNYQIRGAAQQVAGGLQQARQRAISRNVNVGVIFAVVGDDQFRVVTEDDQDPSDTTNWSTIADWNTLVDPTLGQAGPVQTLPAGIQFDAPANCPPPPAGSTPGAATTWGIRFTRLGGACGDLTSCGGAPSNAPGVTNYINMNPATSLATVCLFQPDTGLRRWVNVTVGGRVRSMQ